MTTPIMPDEFTEDEFEKASKVLWTAASGFDCDLIGQAPVGYDYSKLEQNPKNLSDAEIEQQLIAAGVTMPDGASMKIVRDDKTTFHVVIREEDTVRATLQQVLDDNGYYKLNPALRDKYLEFMTTPSAYRGPGDDKKENRVSIASYRLVDYTFGTCAS